MIGPEKLHFLPAPRGRAGNHDSAWHVTTKAVSEMKTRYVLLGRNFLFDEVLCDEYLLVYKFIFFLKDELVK